MSLTDGDAIMSHKPCCSVRCPQAVLVRPDAQAGGHDACAWPLAG
jgi:hypothetical protein